MPHADAISFVVTFGLLQIIFRIVSVVLAGVSVVTEGVFVVVSVVTVKIIMLRLGFGALFFKSLYSSKYYVTDVVSTDWIKFRRKYIAFRRNLTDYY